MEIKANLKEMTFKKRVEHIWEYYKVVIFCSIFAVYAIGGAIYNHFTEKECLLKLIMINGSIPYDGAIIADDFLQANDFNPKKQEIVLSSVGLGFTEDTYQQDYYAVQALIVRLTSGTIDILSAPSDIFQNYAHEGYFMNLNSVFSEEELSRYEELLVYTTNKETQETYPCALDLSDNAWIKKYNYYIDDCYFGIVYNAPNPTLSKDFLLFILNY